MAELGVGIRLATVALAIACACKAREQTSSSTAGGGTGSGTTSPIDASSRPPHGEPRVQVAEVAATITGKRHAFDALLVRATLHAREALDSPDATIMVSMKCALAQWESIAADVRLGAMFEGEDRPIEVVVSGSNLDAIPAACGVRFVLYAHRGDRGITLAAMHWDGKVLQSGPLPSLARPRDGGPSIKVEMRSLVRSLDGVALIGSAAQGPYYLSARYTLTAMRDFEPGEVTILADCTMPDGTHRGDQMSTRKLTHDGLATPLDHSSPLFMGTHIDPVPAKCDLEIALNHSVVGGDPFPELLDRVSIEPAQ